MANYSSKFRSSKFILLRWNKRYMQTDWRLNMFPYIFWWFLLGLFRVISVWINMESILDHLILLKCDAKYESSRNIYIYKWNMKSFSNETLNFFFRKFCLSYILDLAKTVWALRILSQEFSRNFVKKELWALESHVLVNMLLCSSHFTEVH